MAGTKGAEKTLGGRKEGSMGQPHRPGYFIGVPFAHAYSWLAIGALSDANHRC